MGGARAVSRLEPDFHAPGASAGRPLTSPVLSRAPLWIRLLPSGMLQLENEGGRARVVVNEEPLAGTREFPLEALERGVLLELSGCVLLLLHRVPGEPDPEPEAELIGESLELRRKTLPTDHWLLASSESALGACLTAKKSYAEAETLLLRARQGLLAALGPAHERTLETDQRLVQLYEAWGRPWPAAARGLAEK